MVKNLPANVKGRGDEMQVPSLGQEDPLQKEMVTCPSITYLGNPRTEEPGRLYSPWD